jgi:hypothetical protein
MITIEVQQDYAVVRLTAPDLMILNNVLNEVCNGIEVPEFATRVGADIAEARHLLDEVRQLLNHAETRDPRDP